jgi:hypothetical protein
MPINRISLLLAGKMSFIFLVVLFAEPIGTAGAAKLHNYLRFWRGEFEIENVRMCP